MRRMLDSLRKFRLPVLFDKHDYDAIKVAMSQEAKKSQIGGNHYSQMTIQPVEFIEKNNLSYCQGNVIKYICRYNNKHSSHEKQIQDLEKAKHYIDLLIESKKL